MTPEKAKEFLLNYNSLFPDLTIVPDERLPYLESLVELVPDTAHYVLAKIYAAKGMLDKAREHCAGIPEHRESELEELAEMNADIHFLIGERYAAKGDLENALSHYVQCSETGDKFVEFAQQRIQELKS